MIKQYLSLGNWHGEGTLKLSMFEEELPMQAFFEVYADDPEVDEINCQVEYIVSGYEEPLIHHYYFSREFKNCFVVDYENESWGSVQGNGFIMKNFIGIEYKDNHANFEGFETYRFLDQETLLFNGEFMTPDGLRSEAVIQAMKHAGSEVS